MPILTCPTCGSKLEVADEDIGHTVQCGSCQQTFTAEDPSQKKNDGASRKPYKFKEKEEDDRPSRRRDRDDDDRPSRRRDRDDEDDRPSRRRDDDDDDDPDSRYRSRRRDTDRDYEQRYGSAPQTGMGITSMILGIVSMPLSFCYGVGIPCAILGIIFGILSLKTAGRGMGIAGIITSGLAFLMLAGLVLYITVMVMATAPGAGGGGPGGGGGGGGRF